MQRHHSGATSYSNDRADATSKGMHAVMMMGGQENIRARNNGGAPVHVCAVDGYAPCVHQTGPARKG